MSKIVHLSVETKDVPVRIDVTQGSTSPSIIFVIDDYTPTGTASLYIDKPDGTEIFNSCTISGNQVTYKPTPQSFAVAGINKSQLMITESSGTIISFQMIFMVEETIINAKRIVSTDEFNQLLQALQDVETLEDKINTIQKGGLPDGTDLDNAEVGTWNLSNRNTFTNLPSDYVSGTGSILIVSRSSADGRKVQQLFANDRAWVRVHNSETWGPWISVTSVVKDQINTIQMGVLNEGSDLDSLESGTWNLPINYTYVNTPDGYGDVGGVLITSRTSVGGRRIQILYVNNRVWYRYHNTGSWSLWRDISPNAQGSLPDGTNLNNVTFGTFDVLASYNYINTPAPYNGSGAVLIVSPSREDGRVVQQFVTSTAAYTRLFNGAVWYDWIDVGITIDNKFEELKNNINTIKNGQLESGTDLDTLTSGTWNLVSTSGYSNLPSDYENTGGILIATESGTGTSKKIQTIHTSNKQWYRYYNTSTWSPWRNISPDAQGPLPENTDLNTLTTNGTWDIYNSRQYYNLPQNGIGGVLIVSDAKGRIAQQINTVGSIWIRVYNGETWGDWNRVVTETMLDGSINTLQKGILASGTDLDTLTSGTWNLPSNNVYSNVPDGFSAGVLISYRTGNNGKIVQVLYGTTRQWFRQYTTQAWSAWTELANTGHLDLVNTIQRGVLASGTNLNNLTSGTWNLTTNNIYSNIPDGFSAGVLISYRTNVDGKIIQVLYGTTRQWFRQYTTQSWTNWTEIVTGSSLEERINTIQRGVLDSGTDLNTLTTGTWNLITANLYNNVPDGFSSGILISYRTNNNGRIIQVLYGTTRQWFRQWSTSTWTDWTEIPNTNSVNASPKGTLASGSDLNDLTSGTWNLPSSYIYTNAPSEFKNVSGVLIAYKTAENGKIIQVLYSHNRQWFRQWTTSVWGSWWETSSLDQGVLEKGVDLNDVTIEGQYRLQSGNSYINCPTAANNNGGFVSVINANSLKCQIVYTHNTEMYFRTLYTVNGDWTAWRQIQGMPQTGSTLAISGSVNYIGRLINAGKTVQFSVPALWFNPSLYTLEIVSGTSQDLWVYHPDAYKAVNASTATWSVRTNTTGITFEVVFPEAIDGLTSARPLNVFFANSIVVRLTRTPAI